MTMIKIEDALNRIMKEVKILGVETKDLISSLNYILGEDIYSKDILPPFNKSAMDGYAIKSEDTNNTLTLEIKGIIKAGGYYEGELRSGEAFKIMTGAPLPSGADAVIEIEKVKVEGNKLVLEDAVEKGNHVIKKGEEINMGDLALSKGKEIRPAEIGFLASLGYSNIKVYKAPTIALLITGDELIDIDKALEKGKIRNSNEYSLTALVGAVGAKSLSLGIIEDEKDILKEKMKYAFEHADMVISSGGASVGDYDFVEDILKEIGANIHFTKVSIKPGKPVTFATYKEKLFFGLPGNPLSLITTFETFVKPSILKMMGKDSFCSKEISVILGDNFKVKKGRTKYVYVNIKKEDEGYVAYELGSQCSNHLMTLSKANGIIIIPEDIEIAQKGEVFNGRYLFE